MDPYHIRKKKSSEKFMRENPGKWYLRVDAGSGELESAFYYKKDANLNVSSPGNWLNAAKQFESRQRQKPSGIMRSL